MKNLQLSLRYRDDIGTSDQHKVLGEYIEGPNDYVEIYNNKK